MTRNSAHTNKLALSDWKNMPSAVLLSSHVSVCVDLFFLIITVDGPPELCIQLETFTLIQAHTHTHTH